MVFIEPSTFWSRMRLTVIWRAHFLLKRPTSRSIPRASFMVATLRPSSSSSPVRSSISVCRSPVYCLPLLIAPSSLLSSAKLACRRCLTSVRRSIVVEYSDIPASTCFSSCSSLARTALSRSAFCWPPLVLLRICSSTMARVSPCRSISCRRLADVQYDLRNGMRGVSVSSLYGCGMRMRHICLRRLVYQQRQAALYDRCVSVTPSPRHPVAGMFFILHIPKRSESSLRSALARR